MSDYAELIPIIQQGGIIAYPTEAVYGLGCDPFNQQAVTRLLQLKQRPNAKGLILIAAHWQQIEALIAPLDSSRLALAQATWPGPVTWVFPASKQLPPWLSSHDHTIALRLTAHPVARQLCETIGQPLISTSANISGGAPCSSAVAVTQLFGQQLDFVIDAPVGNLAKPTQIRDIMTDKILR